MNDPGTDTGHARYRSQLIELVHGELSAWRALRLRHHLAGCPACRAECHEIERLWGSLRRLAPATSTRPQLKGKTMQLRVMVAVTTVLCAVVSGTIITRSLNSRPREYDTSVVVDDVHQFWYAHGMARGKLEIYRPSGALARNLDVAGNGPGDMVSVRVSAAPDDHTVGEPLASFVMRLNESHEIRDARGNVLSRVRFVPFTAAEDEQHREEASADKTRLEDLYRNPACITTDMPHKSGGGYLEAPGLIAWSLDVLRDDSGKLVIAPNHVAVPLENAGLAWKVYGDARVTMTLLTDKTPIIRHYQTDAWISRAQIAQEAPDIVPLLPAQGSAPKVFWFQSAAFPRTQPVPEGIRAYGHDQHYWLKPDGSWYRTLRSGEFTGYGKHTVTDDAGKPILILDVQPR